MVDNEVIVLEPVMKEPAMVEPSAEQMGNPFEIPADFDEEQLRNSIHIGLMYLLSQAKNKLRNFKRSESLRESYILKKMVKKLADALDAHEMEEYNRNQAARLEVEAHEGMDVGEAVDEGESGAVMSDKEIEVFEGFDLLEDDDELMEDEEESSDDDDDDEEEDDDEDESMMFDDVTSNYFEL